jgi:hypothetical protein
MTLKKTEYIYLLNTLNIKGIINYVEFNDEDNINDMKRIFQQILNILNYQRKRNDYQILKQYIDSLPNQNIENIPLNYNTESSLPSLNINPIENISRQNIQQDEEIQPIDKNFINNENMVENQYPLFQNVDQNIVDPAMQALLNLVSKQHNEIRKMEKLMRPQRANEFIHKNNYYINKEGYEV